MSIHKLGKKVEEFASNVRNDLTTRYMCLHEAFYFGSRYTYSYRWFRFCEAFGLIGDDE